ncbi:hypothetical protein ABIF63_006145 [Bradyrhizobium japonicum]|uniref:Helix-turn-helix domain-containing protein n=1 Tax=Bradyrhizobium japonicum TaxID=375 RepID=A0ABV2RYL7_BRAJP
MADSKIHKAGGLLDQYNLLGAIIDSPWATRLDHKVARHVIDRYYPKHGNGRASLRYLERATGSSRSNITTSLRRLAENGAIVMVRPGHGTRPSEFALNFDFSASVPVDVTSSDDVASGTVDVTSSGHADNTASNASVPVDVTESYLLNPAYKAEIQIDRDDPAAPTAPPLADGLAATAAGGAAVEELPSTQAEDAQADTKPTFEALWRAYDFKRGKDEARAAWNALPPEVDRAAVIEGAKAWQASWAAQGKPDAPRKHLATWLREERYDEDAPRGFQKVERSKAKPKATKPASEIRRYAITARVEEGSPFKSYFETFTFRALDGGHEFSRRLHVMQADAEYAEGADAAEYRELCRATFGEEHGILNPVGEWIGRIIGISEEAGESVLWHLPDENEPPDEPEPTSPPRRLTVEEAEREAYEAWLAENDL